MHSDLNALAGIYTDPTLEGHQISHVPFSRFFLRHDDMRRLVPGLDNYSQPIQPGSVVIDSDMPLHQAFQGLAPECPREILIEQQLVRLFYFGSDGKLHHGQVVIHQALVDDILAAFRVLLKERIPLGSVIPMAHTKFRVQGRWDDNASMEGNNSSGFNYRTIINADGVQQRLSLHGLGMALDINPLNNPCYGSPSVHSLDGYCKEAAAGYGAMVPRNATYDLTNPAALHDRHPLVLELVSRGWTWGGNWANPKDLHHFQKIPPGLEERVKQLRSPG